MAFTESTFIPISAMANSNAPRHYSYTSADAIATVVASGYFNEAADTLGLKAQDMVWTVASNGGTETFTAVFVDAVSAAGVVTTLSSALTLA